MFIRIIIMLDFVFITNVIASESSLFVEKERIAEQLKNNIKFEDELSSLTLEEKEAYLQMLNIEKMVNDDIPYKIYAKDSDSVNNILNSRSIVLKYDNIELNRLTLQKAVMDVFLDLEQTILLPSLDKISSIEIKDDVISIIDKAEIVIKNKMSDLISEEIIEKKLAQLRTELIGKINDVTTYTMKKKPDKQELTNFLSVFEKQLESSKQRAAKRLDRIRVNSGNNDNSIDFELREKEIIINEVILPLRRCLLKTTSPSDLLKLNDNPDQILPGYTDVVKRFSECYNNIINDRLTKGREERNNKAYLRLLDAQNRFLTTVALKNSLDEDTVLDTNINNDTSHNIDQEKEFSELQAEPNNFNATKNYETNIRRNIKPHNILLLLAISSLCMVISPMIFIVVIKKLR